VRPHNGTNASHVYTAADLSITPAANWTITYCYGLRPSPRERLLHLRFAYGGTTITASSSGNIPDTTVATIGGANWRPYAGVYADFAYLGGSGFGTGRVGPDGSVVISTLSPTASITSGQAVRFTAHYIA